MSDTDDVVPPAADPTRNPPGGPAPIAAAVAVKLPEFWTEEPVLWFLQADATFRRCNVTTQATKFDHVVSRLPQSVLASVRSTVTSAATAEGAATAYDDLKKRLVADYDASPWRRAAKIIDHPGLGDGRPSALMATMLALLPGDEKPGYIFRSLFMRRLPSDIREHLVSQKFEDDREMAAMADVLWDARGEVTASAAMPTRMRTPPLRRRGGSPTRSSGDDQQRLCWYHRRWGSKADRCRPPCSYAGNVTATGDN